MICFSHHLILPICCYYYFLILFQYFNFGSFLFISCEDGHERRRYNMQFFLRVCLVGRRENRDVGEVYHLGEGNCEGGRGPMFGMKLL